MIPRHVVNVLVDEMQPHGVGVQIGTDHPGLVVAIVAGRRREDRRPSSLHRHLADRPSFHHLEGDP